MKVAYLFSRYPVPSQTFCDTEIRALEATGCEVEIYACSPPTTSFRHGRADRPRAKVFYAPPASGLERWEEEARRAGSWPEALIADHLSRFGVDREPAKRARHAVYFAQLARRRGIGHVHVHFAARAAHAAIFLEALSGIPFSFTAHAQDFFVDVVPALFDEMYARSSFVVSVSRYTERVLNDEYPDFTAKTHMIHNGLPADRWPEPRYTQAANPGTPMRIFSVGRLIEFKGFDDLITACALLRARGVDFRCEIAGDGPLRRALEVQIADLSLGERVRLLGLVPQEEIRRHLASCDVFALTSRVDGKGACDVLPTVILEAMASGRPVVSTRLAGIPEMVEDGQTGLLVASGDHAAIAEALARLGADAALRERLGRAGRARQLAGFAAQTSARRLAELFSRSAQVDSDSAKAANVEESRSLVCLCDGWSYEAWAKALLARCPGARFLILQTAGCNAPVAACDFLPDAMVLEGLWRDDPAAAHEMESWRGSLGGACSTEDFLVAARRASFLASEWRAGGGGGHIHVHVHVHACGPAAMLCAWMLLRLGAIDDASFLLALPAPGTGLTHGSAHGWTHGLVRRLAPGFRYGWIAGERKLASALGERFHGELPDCAAWVDALTART